MKFLKRIASIFGFSKDEHHGSHEVYEEHEDKEDEGHRETTKGFSAQVPMLVERPHRGPLLVPCGLGDGGVQGLGWYARRLLIDENGYVADEFLNEAHSEASVSHDSQRALPKAIQKPAKVREQVISGNGNVLQSVEFKGKLLWL